MDLISLFCFVFFLLKIEDEEVQVRQEKQQSNVEKKCVRSAWNEYIYMNNIFPVLIIL